MYNKYYELQGLGGGGIKHGHDDWIDTKVSPESGGNYLVVDPNRFGNDKRQVYRYSKSTDRWYFGKQNLFPSHWMPLPQPPKIN